MYSTTTQTQHLRNFDMKALTTTNANGTQFTFTKTESEFVNISVNKNGSISTYITILSAVVKDGTILADRENGTSVNMPIDNAQAVNNFLKGRELVSVKVGEKLDKTHGATFVKNGDVFAYKYL
jgi:hypothetical protein